jgi:polyketide synthase 13
MARYVLRLDVDLDWLGALPAERQVQELLDRGIQTGALPRDYDTERVRRMLETRVHNRMAIARYGPEPYDGRVVLFRATETTEGALAADDPADRQLGWSSLASEVVVHDVAGTHLTVIDPPAIHQVARLAGGYLE